MSTDARTGTRSDEVLGIDPNDELRPTDYDHIVRLSDHRGLFEHAARTVPRTEHGYCTDDNARLLVVTSRDRDVGPAHALSRLALTFVLDAQGFDGQIRNRMNTRECWTDRAGTDDCWGRSMWGLATAAVEHDDGLIRDRALRAFDKACRHRSPSPRSMAFASLGAADVLGRHPDHGLARSLLIDAIDVIGPIPAGDWAWPEPRLTYANAALAEAVIAAGAVLDHPSTLERGLAMLRWLLDLETAPAGHLSVVGTKGRTATTVAGPQFDQQPLEVAAMADACWRALTVTGDAAWARGVTAAEAWFRGANDAGVAMFDASSGGAYDGLHRKRPNANQGAESTLALLSTMQRARALRELTRRDLPVDDAVVDNGPVDNGPAGDRA